jgi:AP-3 complex subunit delta
MYVYYTSTHTHTLTHSLTHSHTHMKVHPRVVAEHKAMILKCLNDEDITIRQRALDLVSGMISKKNLPDIVRILMDHVETSEGSFRHDLVDKVFEI